MRPKDIKSLRELYTATSKHSSYQVLSPSLERLLGSTEVSPRSRHERERFDFVRRHVDFQEKTVLDIGGNTGFFSFGALEMGARMVRYYEGNETHATFVRRAAELIAISPRIEVEERYLDVSTYKSETLFDVCFLLNVLHHFGDDYGEADASLGRTRQHVLESLINLSASARCLVFQLGFNWKGERDRPLFRNGTKAEMIDFILSGVSSVWKPRSIGIAEGRGDLVSYCPMSPSNLPRNDSLGEFLNRPIFILDSLNLAGGVSVRSAG